MAMTGAAKVEVMLSSEQMQRATVLATKEKKAAETAGQRVARLRRERGITQEELAEMLGVTQPVVSDYERDEIRLHGELLLQLAQILHASVDEILGRETRKRQDATVKNRRLARRLQQIEKLPKRDQQAILRTIDAFLRGLQD